MKNYSIPTLEKSFICCCARQWKKLSLLLFLIRSFPPVIHVRLWEILFTFIYWPSMFSFAKLKMMVLRSTMYQPAGHERLYHLGRMVHPNEMDDRNLISFCCSSKRTNIQQIESYEPLVELGPFTCAIE